MMAVALGAALAVAQPSAKREPPATITNVRLGWGGVLTAERWSPVWIDVRGGQNAFEGTLTLEYTQDGTQGAEIILPIATTPGQTVPFEMAICPPRNMGSVTLTISGRGYSQKYEIDSVGSRTAWSLPMISDASVVLVVGDCSASEAFEGISIIDGQVTTTTGYWDIAEARKWIPSELPLGWRAYESVDAVVARAEDIALAEPRARDALMTWVEAGGRLVLVADTAGDRWMECVGPSVVSAAPAARVTPHRSWSGRSEGGITGRVLTLGEAGRRDGWETFWPLADGMGALAARGPVGCGMVTLLGVEPERVPTLVSKSESRRVWRPVFDDAQFGIIPIHRRVFENDQDRFWMSSSGTTQKSMTAIRTGLDAIAGVAAIGDGAFIVIAAAVLLLAGLLGPFDWFVVRKRGYSRWSWATASVWIVSASVAALIAPMVIRADLSTVSRARVVDVIDDGERRGEWATGLSAVFSGSPEVAEFGGVEGSWWRGVSPVMVSQFEHRGASFSPVRTVMRGGDTRGASLAPLPQGQWTFRTVLEQRPGGGVSADLPGVVVSKSSAGYSIEVRGVPLGATVRTGGLRVKDGSVALEFHEAERETGEVAWVAEARSDQVRRTDEVLWGPRGSVAHDVANNDYYYYGTPGLSWPASAMDLPGVAERADAVTARVAAGGWACVVLEMDGGPDAGLPKVENASTRTVLVLRACVRIDEGKTEP